MVAVEGRSIPISQTNAPDDDELQDEIATVEARSSIVSLQYTSGHVGRCLSCSPLSPWPGQHLVGPTTCAIERSCKCARTCSILWTNVHGLFQDIKVEK